MKQTLAIALLAGMVFVGARAAHADTITQKVTFTNLSGYTTEDGSSPSAFNTALGTLTSVSFSDSVTATWSDGPEGLDNLALYAIGVGFLRLNLEPSIEGNGTDMVSGDATTTDPAELADFASGSQMTSVHVSNPNDTPASISSMFGTGILTYTYTPATSVPEPGSLALLGTALAGIGAFGFCRRRRRG